MECEYVACIQVRSSKAIVLKFYKWKGAVAYVANTNYLIFPVFNPEMINKIHQPFL